MENSTELGRVTTVGDDSGHVEVQSGLEGTSVEGNCKWEWI